MGPVRGYAYVVICCLYWYFSSMYDIHRWNSHLSFFPWMTLLSMDKIFPSMDDFDRLKSYPSIKSFLMDWIFILSHFWDGNWEISIISRAHCSKTLIWKYDTKNFHTKTWQIKTPSMDGKILSMDKIVICQNHQ